MKIALVHDHYDKNHLAEVIEQMKTLGAPTIHAVWMECYGHWQALEGCHRVRAAKELGLVPEIIEVEYSDTECAVAVKAWDGGDEQYLVSEIADDSYRSTVIDF